MEWNTFEILNYSELFFLYVALGWLVIKLVSTLNALVTRPGKV